MSNAQEMVDYLLEMDSSLSAWELEFCESISEKLSAYGGDHCLFGRQLDKLQEIWELYFEQTR